MCCCAQWAGVHNGEIISYYSIGFEPPWMSCSIDFCSHHRLDGNFPISHSIAMHFPAKQLAWPAGMVIDCVRNMQMRSNAKLSLRLTLNAINWVRHWAAIARGGNYSIESMPSCVFVCVRCAYCVSHCMYDWWKIDFRRSCFHSIAFSIWFHHFNHHFWRAPQFIANFYAYFLLHLFCCRPN